MRLGTGVMLAGVLGGISWVVRWAVPDGTAADALLWAGAVLLTVLAVGTGTLMVKPVALKAVVGPCVGLLGWSLAAVAGLGGDPMRAGLVGLALIVVAPVTWERLRPLPAPRRATVKPQRAGSHAR